MQRYFHDITIAIEAIQSNKLKSILTALGIIFGVAAVISMLAIGNGARQEILDQMKMVGVNNIVVNPIVPDKRDQNNRNGKDRTKYSPGLTLSDAEAIRVIPSVKTVSPLVKMETHIIQNGIRKPATLYGVQNEYFDLFRIEIHLGNNFNSFQLEHGLSVCIISAEVKSRFFSSRNPIGQQIKCGNEWLTVIGVTETRNESDETRKLGLSASGDAIYTPIKTMLLRYVNRSLITQKSFNTDQSDDEESRNKVVDPNYHQLDQLVVQVHDTRQLNATVDVLKRLFLRRHCQVSDVDIKVPELLLKQQQRTKDIFNVVLGAIAAISLLVGGIGIMNIMLASVMERIKEIGIRRAMGATRKDIMVQFVSESVLISIIGGFIGIVLGYLLSALVTRFAGILTIVSPGSVIVAFGISATVGIVFGFMPARKAAEQDVVVSLRNE